MKKFLSLLFILPYLLQANEASTFDFIRNHTGTVPRSVNGVYTAEAKGLQSLGINPAGLNATDSIITASIGAQLNYDDDKTGLVSISRKTESNSVMALSFSYTAYGAIDALDVNQNNIGTINPYEFITGLHYSRSINSNSSFGISSKYVAQNLTQLENAQTAMAWAFDAGYSMSFSSIGIKYGAALLNLGSQFQAHHPESDLHRLNGSFKTGLSFTPPTNKNFTTSIDYELPMDGPFKTGIAANATLNKSFTLRAAYVADYDQLREMFGNYSNPNRSITLFTAGFSISLKMVDIHYAVEIHKFSLSPTHSAGLDWNF